MTLRRAWEDWEKLIRFNNNLGKDKNLQMPLDIGTTT
jgi:hypothetical protein